VRFTPSVLRSRAPFTARVHVSDTRGYVVRGALVYLAGLPFGRVQAAAEDQTDEAGWASFQLLPTRRLPLVNGGSLVFFARARVAGDRLIAGASTRRLVQVTTRTP